MDSTKKGRGYSAIMIYESLRDDILSLELSPGQLIDEASLAARFNVSRSPVREALVRLVSEALIKTLPNKGTIVAPLRIEEFPQYVDAIDLVQRAVTRLAAELRTTEDIRILRAEQERFRGFVEANDVLGMILSNREFHIAIARAANNNYLEAAYTKLLDDGRRFLRLYFKSYGDTISEDLYDGHDEMIDAIEAKDFLLAEQFAHKHTLKMQQRFLDYLGKRHMVDFAVVV